MKNALFSATFCAAGLTAASAILPAHANTAFDLFTPAGAGNSVGNSTSLTYTVSGTTLTFQNPSGDNSPQLQKNAAGLCAYMTFIGGGSPNLITNVPFCGQNTTAFALNTSSLGVGTYTPSSTLPASQKLLTIRFGFDKEVILQSFTVAAANFQNPTSGGASPGQVGNGKVSFSPRFSNPDSGDFTSPLITMTATRTSNVNFTNSASSSAVGGAASCGADSDTSRCTINFPANYLVKAGTLVTISTPTLSGVSTDGYSPNTITNTGGHWRLYSINAQVVPAPLPLLGCAIAMGWSRRLRQRIAATKQNQVALSD